MPRGDKSYIPQIKDRILSRFTEYSKVPGEIQETKYGIILSTPSRLYPTYIFEMGSEFLVKISYRYLLPHQKEGDAPVTLFYRCYSSEGLIECLMYEMKLVIKK